MTRRDVVKGAVALATLGAGSVLAGRGVAATAASPANRTGGVPGSDRDRVAIIGAGAGGVAAACFLAGIREVDLFEARSKIGGHCDSHVIDYRGHRITVDLGAQFFHPDTHPIYVTLLEELGLYDPAHPGAADTLEAPGSLCIFPTTGGPADLFVVAPVLNAAAFDRVRQLLATRAAGGSVEHVVGDHRRCLGSAACTSASRSRTTSCIRGSRR